MCAVTVVGVLGHVQLTGPEGPIRVGSARQRRMLAALVAHFGAPVRAATLAELVWDGTDAPADPVGAVQTNVARLRRLLPPGVRIATAPEGYQLLADRADVDVTAFADHIAAAARLDDPHARLRRLDAALTLWRGQPFADLDHESVQPEIARLTALRVDATERRAEALLAVGRVGEAIAELEALIAAEPLRESAVAVLMRALVAAGRQRDALAVYAELRTRLADELGLDPSLELRELVQRVLRQEVTLPRAGASQTQPDPVRRAPRPPPVPINSFVGRATDLAVVCDLLRDCRIVTLCGPGGVGKTRLARHIAAAVAERYDDGAVIVELGEGGAGDVEPALAAALRLSEAGTRPLTERIVDLLSVRNQLLVLDNCEHVAEPVAVLVEAIATGAGGVDLLLTSREPIRVDGERVYDVHPLDPASAAQLLVDRVRAGGGEVEAADADVVEELCRRLDRLPLALELAAARARPLGLRGLLAALDTDVDGSLDLLRGGRRTTTRRHRSLRSVVEWSYGLLDTEQRTLFDRLSVFAGPVEYAAVVDVCGDAGALPDLVDRSLAVRTVGEPVRFGMLETLRAFGRTRVAGGAEGVRLRSRHAAWACRLADEIGADRRGPGEAAAVRRFDAHLADLRRAHAWLCESGPVEDLLRLTVPFAELAYLRGRVDLVRVTEQTLRVVGALATDTAPAAPATHPLVARLLGVYAATWWQRGDLDTSERHARRAIAIAEAVREPAVACQGYEALANVYSFRGDLAGALRNADIAYRLALDADDFDAQCNALLDLVIQSAYAGDHESGDHYEAVLAELAERTGAPTVRGFLAYCRGERRAMRGDPAAARYLEEAMRAAERAGSGFVAGIARHTLLTSAARTATDPATALLGFGPLLDYWHSFGAWTQLWIAIRALVETLSRLERYREAAVLLGALWASPRASRVYGPDLERLRAVEQAAQTVLGAAFDQCRDAGARLGDSGAIALARRLTRD